MVTRWYFPKTSRIGAGLVVALVAACVVFSLGVFIGGCEDDSEEEPVGTSVIQGTVDSFEGNGAYYFPAKRQNLWVRIASEISEALVPYAYAGQAGITVYLLRDGSVFRSTTTDDEGTFVFSEVPAGDYQFRFEYQGHEVTYLGESGQIASITVGTNQMVSLVGVKVKGGQVNIGNIRVVQLDQSAQSMEGGESARESQAPPNGQTNQETGSMSGSTIWYSGIRNAGFDEVAGLDVNVNNAHLYTSAGFDVNNDGAIDFEFSWDDDTLYFYFVPMANNQAVGPLSENTLIDQQNSALEWYAEKTPMLRERLQTLDHSTWAIFGPWGISSHSPERIGYMGLKFTINGATHYGWLRLTVTALPPAVGNNDWSGVTLNDWAYETRPGVGIKAGQTE